MTAIGRRAAIAGSASLLATPAFARSPSPMNATDTLLVYGKVTTLDPSNPVAAAVLLRDGRIAAAGMERDVRQQAERDAEVIDLGGRRVIPGLLADIAVLSEDCFAVPEEDIRQLGSVLTFAGGNVVRGVEESAGLMPELPPLKPDWSPVTVHGGTYRREA